MIMFPLLPTLLLLTRLLCMAAWKRPDDCVDVVCLVVVVATYFFVVVGEHLISDCLLASSKPTPSVYCLLIQK